MTPVTTATKPRLTGSAWIVMGHAIVIGALLALWQGIAMWAGPDKLATPAQSAAALIAIFPQWLPDLASTLVVFATAFVITAVVGVALGFLIGISAFWTDVLRPILTTLYAVPKIAIYPIFLIIFKISHTTLILFAVFHGILPVIIIVMEAVRSIPAIQIKLAKVYRLPMWKTFIYVLLPSAAPAVGEAVRIGASLAFLGVIIAEMFGSTMGLGHRLIAYLSLHQVDRIIAVFTVISVLGIAVSLPLLAWQRSVQSKAGKDGAHH